MSLMGYRSTLLRSIVVLVLFYGGGSVVAFYFLGPQTLEAWVEDRGLVEDIEVNALNAASVATEVVVDRFRETGIWLGIGVAVAMTTTGIGVGIVLLRRRRRARARGTYRGLAVSLSVMPMPPKPRVREVAVDLPRAIPRAHRPLLHAILGYLKEYEDAWCGDGHNVGLLQHSLHVLQKALEHPDGDELLPLVAAAHDMGKATSYEQRGGEWVRIRYHDKEGARILAALPEWWELEDPERTLLLYAVKYEHAPRTMPSSAPGLDSNDIRRLERIIEQIREVDGLATADEKQAQLEGVDVESLVVGAFLRVLPQLPFQVKDLPKGTRAAGWRSGDRLFLIEHRVRDLAMSQMDTQTAAAMGGDYRATGEKADFTRVLLPALARRGWLVTEAAGEKGETWQVEPDEALWHIRAGKMPFHGVFAVDLPADYHHYFPAKSPYSITVTGPLTGGIAEAAAEERDGTDSSGGSRRPRQPRSRPVQEARTGTEGAESGIPATEAAPVALMAEADPSGSGEASPEDLAREALAEAADEEPGGSTEPSPGVEPEPTGGATTDEAPIEAETAPETESTGSDREEAPPAEAPPEAPAATEESADTAPANNRGSAVGQIPDFLQ